MFDPLLLSTKLVKPEYLTPIMWSDDQSACQAWGLWQIPTLHSLGGGGVYCIISLFVMQGPQKFVQLLLFGSGFVVR